MRDRLLAIGLLALTFGAAPAAADVDLNGPWRLTVQSVFISGFVCQVTVTGWLTSSFSRPLGATTLTRRSGLAVAPGVLPKAPMSARPPLGAGSLRK